ncbi:hypothetical protein DEGR_33500 (plasmid) [Deinococcus grandis]|nr:hypothetical protein DEGR_33500 [Deinococcus grandis]
MRAQAQAQAGEDRLRRVAVRDAAQHAQVQAAGLVGQVAVLPFVLAQQGGQDAPQDVPFVAAQFVQLRLEEHGDQEAQVHAPGASWLHAAGARGVAEFHGAQSGVLAQVVQEEVQRGAGQAADPAAGGRGEADVDGVAGSCAPV